MDIELKNLLLRYSGVAQAFPLATMVELIKPSSGDTLDMELDICFVPSLQHLCCAKIVTSLLNKVLPFVDISEQDFSSKNYDCTLRNHPILRFCMPKHRCMKYNEIKCRVKEDIKKLTPCALLQKKLENFIGPLYYEIAEFIETFHRSVDTEIFIIMDNIPHCWLTDGTIDREKSAKSLFQSSNIPIVNLFKFACHNCLHEDVLNLWELLSEMEKDDLRSDSDFIVREWITWLESRSNKGWQFCLAWILGTEFWNKNMCALKRILAALTPKERSHYLRKALCNGRVSCDVMRFGLTLMSREEQELFLKAFPREVLKCITSWSVQSNFFDIADSLWPYLTGYTFCDILNMLLWQAKKQDFCDEFLVNLKTIWTKRPSQFQNIQSNDRCLSKPLQFVLKHDFTQAYPLKEFLAQLTVSCFV